MQQKKCHGAGVLGEDRAASMMANGDALQLSRSGVVGNYVKGLRERDEGCEHRIEALGVQDPITLELGSSRVGMHGTTTKTD